MAVLKELLRGIEHQVLQGGINQKITGIKYDSRQIKEGDAFVCMPGFNTDGHLYASQAVANGARVLLVERNLLDVTGCTMVQVKNTREILPLLAARFYNRPSRALRVIGVTGTNGKTTTTHLIKAILEEAGFAAGLIGTLDASFEGYQENCPIPLGIVRFGTVYRRVSENDGNIW